MEAVHNSATVYYSTMDSPVGRLTICCSEKGVLQVAVGRRSTSKPGDANGRRLARPQWVRSREKTRQLEKQLAGYFAGRRRKFPVRLDLRGTPFQRKVWEALRSIPYGETRSYADVARRIGRPRAARAVGMANHWNPVAILVPCHRVIAADGGLGGYASGLRVKKFLLQLEQRRSRLR